MSDDSFTSGPERKAGDQRVFSNGGWFLALLLVVATFVAYQPAWNGKPLFDDDPHLISPELRSLSGLGRIWTELGVVLQYYPVFHSALWVQCNLWGHTMLGYHLVNVSLHALCALLLLKILKRLEIPGAWLAVSIFALHPVMVESVAWISELKNTLSTVFYLCAALAYLRFDRSKAHKREPDAGRARSPLRAASTAGPDWRAETARPASVVMNTRFEEQSFYILALILFVLGLLSKSVVASLPAALLVVFWWKRGRLSWKLDVRPLIPFFVAALAMGALTLWVERKFIGAEGQEYDLSFVERCLVAGRAVWFYLGTLLWPAGLTFIYPRWEVSQAVWWQYLFPSMLLVLLAGLWRLRRRWRGPLAALLFFGGTLFPALGFINVYPFRYSFVADHYVYLAALGLIVLAAASLVTLVRRAKASFCCVLLMTLFFLTWRQCHMYTDSETLWRTTLARNPACYVAHQILGNNLLQEGRVDEAIRHCQTALRLQPGVAEAHNNLGNALLRKGQTDEAMREYQKAVQLRPDLAAAHYNIGAILLQRGQEAMPWFQAAVKFRPNFAEAHNSLGDVLMRRGQLNEAIVHLERALEIRPNYADARNNLGNALLQKGRADDAIVQYRKALDAQPDHANVQYNLGVVLSQKGRVSEAIQHYRQALDIQPGFAAARNNLGNILLELGRVDEAIAQLRTALELEPGFAPAHNNLALALLRKGQARDALACYQSSLELQPENVRTLSEMAWLLATWRDASVRNGPGAIELAQRANQLSGGRDPAILRTLAAAYAEGGRFADATTMAQRALHLADAGKDVALAELLRVQIRLYQRGMQFPDPMKSE